MSCQRLEKTKQHANCLAECGQHEMYLRLAPRKENINHETYLRLVRWKKNLNERTRRAHTFTTDAMDEEPQQVNKTRARIATIEDEER